MTQKSTPREILKYVRKEAHVRMFISALLVILEKWK